MKKHIFSSIVSLALAVTVSAPAFAAEERYDIDQRHTYPIFEVSHFGFSTQRGRFDKTEGSIVLDRAGRTGSVTVAIDAASISMGAKDWDDMMRSDKFFDVARYPTMKFRSTRLIFEGENVVAAEGEFTLLGQTRPLRLEVANFRCGNNPIYKKDECGADVTATIKRSDYGMKEFLPAVGDTIRLIIPVEAFKVVETPAGR